MEPCARSALPVRAALLCAVTLLASPHHNSEAQVVSVKTLRSSNFRRDDSNHLTELYRKEETIIVSGSGHIQSPRYPSSYPRNLLLSWKLLCPPSSRILLDFDVHFGLEEAENDVCRYDFVEVEDISETSTIIWGRWCGQKAPSRITSKTNTLKVTFKSDNYFVAKPGFKLCYSLLGPSMFAPAETEVPMNAAALDQAISAFSTVEEMLRHLNPESWQEDMDSLYSDTTQYRPRVYHQYDRKSKIDLDRLYEDVKRYSCTPRNYSVNLREELRATNAVFFPRCLLVQRCGGNCACGTDNWNSCTCGPGKIISKLHEVLKFSPGPGYYKSRTRARWVLEEIYLQHHERCDCMCHSRPPR
ncbi:platelet-derived growth factor D isoform X3 [Denticeps clupeoides]|uniref:platelet-derived growth factor D isoform X3 n=1 Tax=Denticeps clupeoides TaxID=299321 RepID=UPI0010A55F5C|nr:platelet-derived growth factor D isoform X3 [Denticeps clupeoides]